jgi:hypothetical protein
LSISGLRVPDDDAGPVDAEGHLAFAPHDPLGVVLGLEVRVVEVFGLLEHVLAEGAVVHARRGDRAHVVESARRDRLGKADRIARAVDVGELLVLRARGDVVNRGQVEEMVDLALEFPHVGGGYAEPGLSEVAKDADHLFLVRIPMGAHRRELLLRALAHEDVDRLPALEQVRDEEAADESGRAADEVGHLESPCILEAVPAAAGGAGDAGTHGDGVPRGRWRL